MNIYIGENIKSLRKLKNITQEKLAEHLNISCQAVSKWERGETFPDLSLIIPLASYFGVTTDDLLGFNQAENEKRIQEYLDEYYRLGALGKVQDKFNLMCQAYKDFPNDFRIVEEYAWQLYTDYNGDGKYQEELYKICDRILNECTLDSPRYSALSILGGLYLSDGNLEKAIETAKRFPINWLHTTNEEMESIYECGTDEWWSIIQQNISDFTEGLTIKIRNCALYSKMPPEENIKIFQKAIDIFNIIYDNGDYGFNYYHLNELNIWIGNRYIMLGDYEKAAYHIDLGLSYAKAYVDLPRFTPHKSFLVDKLTFDKMDAISGYEGNCITRELNYLAERDFYDGVRDMDWFKEILDKYKMYL